MSTVSTQLNWGTSYLVNDVYARFIKPDAVESELITVSRVITLGVMALSAVVTFSLESVRQAWEYILESGAGIGLVLILRWYWWRITATSEIAALVAAAGGFVFIRIFTEIQFPETLLYLVPWTTVCWLVATFLTPPEPTDHLVAFYRRVWPGGPGWRRVASLSGAPTAQPLRVLWLNWIAGCTMLYGALFAVGSALFRSTSDAFFWFAVAAVGAGSLYRNFRTQGG